MSASLSPSEICDLYNVEGNRELLNEHLVAFFASRSADEQAAEKAKEWAIQIATTDKVVISGFNSTVEREVLDILLRYHRPVVIALGRSLYKRVPKFLKMAFDDNKVLFISFRNYSRQSRSSAQIRNWGTTSMVKEVVFAPFERKSALSSLHHLLYNYSNTPVSILK